MPPLNIGPNILSWLPEEQIEDSALQQIRNLYLMISCLNRPKLTRRAQ